MKNHSTQLAEASAQMFGPLLRLGEVKFDPAQCVIDLRRRGLPSDQEAVAKEAERHSQSRMRAILMLALCVENVKDGLGPLAVGELRKTHGI